MIGVKWNKVVQVALKMKLYKKSKAKLMTKRVRVADHDGLEGKMRNFDFYLLLNKNIETYCHDVNNDEIR